MPLSWNEIRHNAVKFARDNQSATKHLSDFCSLPESATDKQRVLVEAKAQAVLAARVKYLAPVAADVSPLKLLPTAPNIKSEPTHVGGYKNKACTLADLYDPLAMPPELVQAHAELDRAVEKCYRPEPFHSDRERVEYLFSRYEKLTAPPGL